MEFPVVQPPNNIQRKNPSRLITQGYYDNARKHDSYFNIRRQYNVSTIESRLRTHRLSQYFKWGTNPRIDYPNDATYIKDEQATPGKYIRNINKLCSGENHDSVFKYLIFLYGKSSK